MNQKVSIEEFREMLIKGIVGFVYTKKDGSTREAKGTLNLDLIPLENHPIGITKTNVNIVNYFDTDKRGWRSFHRDNFQYVTEFTSK